MARSFIQELKRRNVIRVAAIYVLVSWLLMQIGDVMFPALRLPEWTTTMLVAFLLLGLPIALILSWAYEATPEGIKRTSDVDPDESITSVTGRKINYFIIGVLVVAVVFLGARDLQRNDHASSSVAEVQEKSIAVLPFANRSAAEENAEFFAAGVHDELLTLLSKIGGIKVISRTSVENIADGLSIPQIGKLLGVATVLEGQVQRAGNTLRINVQLINAAQEDHLWATTYDRELTAGNVFQVQSEIARTIADSLHAELTESDESLLASIPTKNTEALRLFMLGRQLVGLSAYETVRRAARYFEQAVELDPNYAKAWAAAAESYASMLQTGMISVEEYIDAAKPAVSTALQIDDELAEAHAQQGNLQWHSGNLEAAELSFERALELSPGDSTSLLAFGAYLRRTGRPQQAIPILERALVADPLSLSILFEIGKSEMYVGHPKRTEMYARRSLEIGPSALYGRVAMLQAYYWMGRFDLVWPWFIEVIDADPEDDETIAHIGLFAEQIGAADWADRYIELAYSLGPDKPVPLKCDAMILTHRGQHDQALTVARKALAAGVDDRWSSDMVFLRVVRDHALRTGDHAVAREWYLKIRPELFDTSPAIDIDNVVIAADLALLLRRSGEADTATVLIEAALTWYRANQVPDVYGSLLNIVYVELLALNSEKDAALTALRSAVDQGWRANTQWALGDEGLKSIADEPEFKAMVIEIENDMATQLEAIRSLPNMGEFDLR